MGALAFPLGRVRHDSDGDVDGVAVHSNGVQHVDIVYSALDFDDDTLKQMIPRREFSTSSCP